MVGLSLAMLIGAVPAALANSFSHYYDDVAFGYGDGEDSFGVAPEDGNGAHVRLAPGQPGGGSVLRRGHAGRQRDSMLQLGAGI